MKVNNSISVVNLHNGQQRIFGVQQPSKHIKVAFKSRDFLDLSKKDIFEKIKDSLVPDNFLGHGIEANVYRIKNTNYCVRIPYKAQEIYKADYSKELTSVDKVNHVVAKLGFGAAIMEYFEGIVPKWYMNNDYNRFRLQEKISDMPVKSYSELLHQIAEAIDNEMFFDFSPGNLIVDIDKQKLTAIDFYTISENPRSISPMTEMYSVLTCYGAEKKTGKKIFDKITEAGLEEFKSNIIPCMDLELFDFIDLVLKRYGDNKNYKQNNITNKSYIFNRLKNSLQECLTELKRIKKSEIIDKTLSPILTHKITEFKNLMKKIH